MNRICILIVLTHWFVFQDKELRAQNMFEVYANDFLTFEEKGNDPYSVALYWNQIGNELVYRLRDGEEFGLENPDQVLAGLIEVNGDPRDAKDVQSQIMLMLREKRATDLDKNSAHYTRNALDRAQKTFALIGPELGQKLVQEKLRKRLPNYVRRMHDEQTGLRAVLANEQLSKTLGITSKQRAKIERYTADARQEFKVEAEETIAKIRIATDKQWSEFLSRLSEQQREKVCSIAGEPVDWYSEFDVPEQWNRSWPLGIRSVGMRKQVFYGSEVDVDNDDDGRWLHEKSEEEIEKLGLLKADRYLVQLMNVPIVQSYLELDLEQLEGWRILNERYQKKGILYYEPDRKKKLNSLTTNLYPNEFRLLLNKAQLQDLRWLEYQARTGGSVLTLARSLLPKEFSQPRWARSNSSLPAVIRELYSKPLMSRKMDVRRGLEGRGLASLRSGIDTKPAYELCRIRNKIEESLVESLHDVLTTDQIELYHNLISRRPREGR